MLHTQEVTGSSPVAPTTKPFICNPAAGPAPAVPISDPLCFSSFRTPSGHLEAERNQAHRKALQSLARYKFMMFGYWAAVWVHLNRLCPKKEPNPFAALVRIARQNR